VSVYIAVMIEKRKNNFKITYCVCESTAGSSHKCKCTYMQRDLVIPVMWQPLENIAGATVVTNT